MKKLFLIILCGFFFFGCKKDRYVFIMKTVKLNSYHKPLNSSQNISVRIVTADENAVLAVTDSYPADYTLPATYALNPSLHLHLYKDPVVIQLWGDSTGFIASSTLDMDEYKIIYPIEMETENENVSFSVMGSWE